MEENHLPDRKPDGELNILSDYNAYYWDMEGGRVYLFKLKDEGYITVAALRFGDEYNEKDIRQSIIKGVLDKYAIKN